LQGVVDPRLARHATSALPAWLWSTDGLAILWANPVGARLFGAANSAALAKRTFGSADAQRQQVVQLAGRLSSIGAIRMERLRGFGASLGSPMTCACARLDLADGGHGILIVATEPLRHTMPLIERLQLLVEGVEAPIAVFSRDGFFVAASEAGRPLFGFRDLSETGLGDALSDALANGRVERPFAAGQMVLQRVGSGNEIGLVALMTSSVPSAARPDTVTAETPIETIVAVEPDGEPSSDVGAVADESSSPSAPQAPPAVESAAKPPRPHPLRFTWRMDADTRFSLGEGEFTGLIGPQTAASFGRPWREIAEDLGFDAQGRVLDAMATRNTWSGITVDWPVDGGGRLPVELSGLPIHDSKRNFAGYRGFGVCRDLDSLAHLRELRRLEPLSQSPISLGSDTVPTNLQHASAAHPPATDVVIHLPGPPASMADEISPTDLDEAVEPPKNVVPFRPPGEPKSPALTPVEDNAFNELARQLSLQLERNDGSAPEVPVTGEAAEQCEQPHEPLAAQAPSGPAEWLQPAEAPARGEARRDRALLDLLPTGVLIYRLDRLLYANPAFLARLGYDSLHALEHAGGLDALYVEAGVSQASSTSQAGTPVTISAGHESSGPSTPAEARLFTITWDGESALALIFAPTGHAAGEQAATVAAPVPPVPTTPPPLAGHAEGAANAKADLLARISHEVRAPLNTIIGFAEVMIGERFGALGNERYVEYLKDIRTSGERVAAVINEHTEISRIETGTLDLAFTSQNLNELVESCVTLMQPQANRERIIIRTSLAQSLPPVVADGRTLRQITMNLIGSSIHLANPAGQVIVSTALSDLGEVVLRVRDTGQGLNDNEVAAVLEPSHAPQSSDNGSPVNLSLTKALVEANRARFHIRTAGRSGTLIEVVFPRALAR
jgi:signal transduction histidine kinase